VGRHPFICGALTRNEINIWVNSFLQILKGYCHISGWRLCMCMNANINTEINVESAVVQKGLFQVIDLRNILVLTRKYVISVQSGSTNVKVASLIHN
jgi:hypothetical protein